LTNKVKGNIAIIGIGEHPTGMFPDKPASELFYYAVREAIKDAGISKDEIDAIIVEPCLADRWFNTDLIWSRTVDEIGVGGRCKVNVQVHSGGSTSSNSIRMALGLILSGQAETVLVAHVEKLGAGPLSAEEVNRIFSTVGIYEEWEAPYGLNYNVLGAFMTQRYMYETGTTIEEVASVIVSLRKWAALNPNALLRRPLTVEEVLKAKMVAYPLTSRMCNIVTDSAHAYIVTSARRAEKTVKTPVYLLGIGGIVTHFSFMKADITRFGWKKAGEEAFKQAGIKCGDVDVVELYDSYPVVPLIQLEELGFCERGKAGRFVYEGHTWPGGKLPMTTDGGSLCRGHSGAGGCAHVVEAARQLMGKAGERQVKNAKIAIATNVGGQYMDAQVMVFGSEIP